MKAQLFFEQVEERQALPVLKKRPDIQQLVMWAGASEDFNLIHFDKDYAISSGLPDIIAQGPLRIAFLGQLLTDWIGDAGRLEKFSSRLTDIVPVNTALICSGKVVKKYREAGKNLVECELWIENEEGKINTTALAVVSLPAQTL
jgi:acyl dehydratase